MTKQIIIKELSERHIAFVDYILSLSNEEFMFSFNDKWAAGQQMDHIYRAISFLPLGFRIPTFITGIVFGKVNRPLMEYDELVENYVSKLNKGAKATTLFIPKSIPYSSRIHLADVLLIKVSKINEAIDKIGEKDLDRFQLPHPILGKLTYREMLYFTLYHVNHHCGLAKQYLAKK